jgi:hypothetical protein
MPACGLAVMVAAASLSRDRPAQSAGLCGQAADPVVLGFLAATKTPDSTNP